RVVKDGFPVGRLNQCEQATVGAESHIAIDPINTRAHPDGLTGFEVPDPRRARPVVVKGDVSSTGMHAEPHGGAHSLTISTDPLPECLEQAARLGIPDPDRPVPGGREESTAVGMVADTVPAQGVAAERALLLAGHRVPELDVAVLAGGGDLPAIGPERDRRNP